mmetsp:Transcript_71661/g.87884  ORF Transcript_71661/g.87884 Transcript_71661/m.87884 type:complete len:196 (+) Transcript_71661:45-632(+)
MNVLRRVTQTNLRRWSKSSKMRISPSFKRHFSSTNSLVGTSIPFTKFWTTTADGPKEITTDDIFKNKKVVGFTIVGAYTGICRNDHLPSFVANKDKLKAKGVDDIICIAVNDIFVMQAFKEDVNGDGITMLTDIDNSFCTALNKTIDLGPGKGFGVRPKRFSFYVDNGVIKKYFEESEVGQVKVTDAETILKELI